MKKSLLVLALFHALLAGPAAAQQGPAGVPGAPLIGAVIAPAKPAPAPEAQNPTPRKPATACSKAKDVEQCKARYAARKQAREACKELKGTERKQCISDYLTPRK